MTPKRADPRIRKINLSAVAVYPGSFDPPTLGHVSLVERGLSIFQEIIVAVANNPLKKTLFTVDERVSLLKATFAHLPEDRITIDSYVGLTVDYAHKKGATAILRGLRATSDFEYEFQMALMNKHLQKGIQSVFLMADQEWFYISSSVVKEAASLGGEIRDLVPSQVAEMLSLKLKPEK
jgi:pantetheine-phosphate adenylyltransferase